MKRKLVSALLVLTMGLSLIGCGQTGEKEVSEEKKQEVSKSEEKTSAAESSEEEPEELDPYTVTYWVYCADSEDAEMVDEAFNERLAELLPNTTVEFVRVAASEFKDRWNKALASGEKIDIGWSANWVNNVANDIGMGVVNPLNDVLAEYGQGIIEAVGGQSVIDMHTYNDGNCYFVPCWQGLAGRRSAIYINQQIADLLPEGWLEEAQEIAFANNYSYPENQAKVWEKLEEIFEIAEENDMMMGGALTNGYLYRWTAQNNSSRGLFNNVAFVSENEPGVFEVQKWWGSNTLLFESQKEREWNDKGWDVAIDGVTREWKDGVYLFTEEQALDDNWVNGESTHNEVVCSRFLLNPSLVYSTGYETGTVFPITGENLERSVMVANLLYTDPELYQLLVYGIEGTHYVKNGDGTITMQENPTYTGPANWTIGSCINSLATTPADLNKYQDIKKLEETALVNTIAGFTVDASNFTTEIANIKALHPVALAAIKAAEDASDLVSVYAEQVELFEKAGYSAYFDEIVKQLTEYVESRNLGTVKVIENPVWE